MKLLYVLASAFQIELTRQRRVDARSTGRRPNVELKGILWLDKLVSRPVTQFSTELGAKSPDVPSLCPCGYSRIENRYPLSRLRNERKKYEKHQKVPRRSLVI